MPIQGAMKAIASKNVQMYERMSRSAKKDLLVVLPPARSARAVINSALSHLLNQLSEDSGLFTCLDE